MVIFVAGSPGSGKTYYVQWLLDASKTDWNSVLAIDPNGEYPEIPNENLSYDHEDLVNRALKEKNKFIIFEEAVAFFHSNNTKKVRELFIRHRHLGHFIVCNFHSLSTIPKDMLMSADYLFHTNTLDKEVPPLFYGIEDETGYTRDEIKMKLGKK